LAEELAHPYSKAYALGCASWFNLYLRDIQTAEHHAHNAVELSIEQGFIWWLIWGTILGGRAMADSGEASTSVAQMKEGIEGWRKTGSAFTIPYFLALLSEACAADGQTEDALNLVAEARTLVEKTGEGFFEAELHRLTGELLSRLEQKEAMKSIEDCYRRAYDIARVQGAKALELRASMSLGRFWHEQGKTEEAHHILSDTLSWFEGRAKTRDVLDARELLQSFQVKQGTRPQRHAPRRKQSAVSSQPE
jgi:predicted ATPase